MFERRLTLIVGTFGSGKTEIAVNAALHGARRGERISLVDLDVVKPYFQAHALHAELACAGVRVAGANGQRDFPDVPVIATQVFGLLMNAGPKVIVDVGGDPVGTLAIGALADSLVGDDLEHLLVLNFARPMTESVEQAVTMARAIQAAARLPLTGLVANTHLIGETTPELVMEGLQRAGRVSSLLDVPLAFVAVEERLLGAFPPGWAPCPVLPLQRRVFPPFAVMQPGGNGTGRAVATSLARP